MGKTAEKSLTMRPQTASNSTASNSVVRSLKHQLAPESPEEVAVKRQNTSEEEDSYDEVDLNYITAEDLTNDNPSKTYWKKVAEKRQVALLKASKENERLKKKIENLKEEMIKYKQMLDDANSFVEIIREELGCSATDDTGIDVNDVSTADERAEADDTAEIIATDATADTVDETEVDATETVE